MSWGIGGSARARVQAPARSAETLVTLRSRSLSPRRQCAAAFGRTCSSAGEAIRWLHRCPTIRSMSRPPPSDAVRAAVAGCPHLAVLPTAALESAVDSTWIRTLAADEAVYRAGDPGDAMFVVASGRIVARLSSSEGAAVDLAVASRGALFGYLELVEAADADGRVVLDGPQVVVAQRLGIARQTLSRTWRRLSADGLVRVGPTGRVITLVDPAGLRGLAGTGARRHRAPDEGALGAPAGRSGNDAGYTTENPAGSPARPVSAASTTGPWPRTTAVRASSATDSASTDSGNATAIPVAAEISAPCTASSNVRVGR